MFQNPYLNRTDHICKVKLAHSTSEKKIIFSKNRNYIYITTFNNNWFPKTATSDKQKYCEGLKRDV